MNPATTMMREGVAAALGAYVLWGLVPIFFKQLGGVPALEIIAHRVVWSLLLVGGLLAVRGRLAPVWRHAQNPRTLLHAALAAALVMTNWFIFVWAVNVDRILETSLGYFITPLVSIVLGVVVLHERLRPRQWAAVVLAVTGVALEGKSSEVRIAGGRLSFEIVPTKHLHTNLVQGIHQAVGRFRGPVQETRLARR
jgi:chloramphenicol-sensitive protein RarD